MDPSRRSLINVERSLPQGGDGVVLPIAFLTLAQICVVGAIVALAFRLWPGVLLVMTAGILGGIAFRRI